MRVLPVEALSLIFQHIAPPFAETTSPTRRPTGKDHPPPLIIASVCSYWRKVARSTPQLWKNASIQIRNIHDIHPKDSLLHLYFAHARNVGLSVSLYYSQASPMTPAIQTSALHVANCLYMHSENLSRLRLIASPLAWFPVNFEFPVLEELHITSHSDHPVIEVDLSGAVSLSFLRLETLRPKLKLPPHPTRLFLEPIPLHECIPLLLGCRNLIEFRSADFFSRLSKNIRTLEFRTNMQTFRRLDDIFRHLNLVRRLVFDSCSDTAVHFILHTLRGKPFPLEPDRVYLPALEELEIKAVDSHLLGNPTTMEVGLADFLENRYGKEGRFSGQHGTGLCIILGQQFDWTPEVKGRLRRLVAGGLQLSLIEDSEEVDWLKLLTRAPTVGPVNLSRIAVTTVKTTLYTIQQNLEETQGTTRAKSMPAHGYTQSHPWTSTSTPSYNVLASSPLLSTLIARASIRPQGLTSLVDQLPSYFVAKLLDAQLAAD
ncbi:hypothetical protein P691DRAFT_787244 [Macrolepiota fuliginosa MF-IS2]|uniref:F-box domain-containing protein n=1 Tax=Macrolepiota fuliginosa MF-IS2 TaxID=1400762 RepID=A0A9P6BZZ5_9AGAR|nr:hypothetical protein P691DRAFT_787244 [Macrolepiota fuliginosa MF-IS2]